MLFFRQTNVWHSPFCIDLHESTFKWLRQFIEKYCEQIESHQPTLNEYVHFFKTKFLIIYRKISCRNIFYFV